MSTDQQSVGEQPSDTEADDQQDVLAHHRQAQERGEVFQGRRRVEIEIEAKRVPRPDGKLPDA
ncbi:hypothetical protein [Haloarcula argentinensis]|uniref:Uncharacterized protein n=1 Tax=Haloarcula argentinensis TaxID=43776 RepID=A0A830FWE6_HALAR|nr:hypothetical protein [Haloarcula argentinensis]EMA26810.1 hypothetical protein C443_00557 [Haloarcula argentinensis DSM 12282]MDS0255762.1 hypothetical protein [Haloarcula argentinensis]GGM51290.1 hypothetical protein GCM10009006_35580 [Haloarcula argentinensis]